MASRRRTTGSVRVTRGTQRFRDEESPDPIALTPTQRRTNRTLATSPTTSHTSARSASISGDIPSSDLGAVHSPILTTTTTRLRSGRRSKGFVPVNLGDGDLVVPSDEDEFEVWAETKRGESSKMAQMRYERQASTTRNQIVSLGLDVPVNVYATSVSLQSISLALLSLRWQRMGKRGSYHSSPQTEHAHLHSKVNQLGPCRAGRQLRPLYQYRAVWTHPSLP